MRLGFFLLATVLATGVVPAGAQDVDYGQIIRDSLRRARGELARAYQGRLGPEQTERFSRKVKLGRDGRVILSNISGDVIVTGGSGDDVSIEAVKRARGDARALQSVQVQIDERPGRVDIQTVHERGRNDRAAAVDYTLSIPASAAVELRSVSGDVRVTGVRGAVRVETVSGDLTAIDTPRLEFAKSVSGDLDLTGAGAEGDLSAGSVSGNIRAKGLRVRELGLNTVSGDLVLTDVRCERLAVRSVSGDVEFSGVLARNGRYEFHSHSGSVRLILANSGGFDLRANTFSGSVRSDLPLTLGGGAREIPDGRSRGPGRSMQASFGDGSATLIVRTFSGDIAIVKQ